MTRDVPQRSALESIGRTMEQRPRVLVLTGYYLPGNRGGGPVRSVSNMVERFGDEFEFRIVTPDRDFGSNDPYQGIDTENWVPSGKGLVRYVTPAATRRGEVVSIVRTTPHDLVYLNSFFHAQYTLAPLLARRIGRLLMPRVLVAPRGELGRGALRLKAWKKRPFLAMSSVSGLYAHVVWHATSEEERSDIHREVAAGATVHVAANLATPAFLAPPTSERPLKQAGHAQLIFASRLMRKKNLAHLLAALAYVRGNVSLHVYGPIEDSGYWVECQGLANALPSNVTFSYQGSAAADDMPSVLDRYHVFVLPTLNENYGHAIVEALARGLPAIISDATPWSGIVAKGAGAVVPLDHPKQLAAAIQTYVDMPAEDFEACSKRAAVFGRAQIDDEVSVEATRHMLTTCARSTARARN